MNVLIQSVAIFMVALMSSLSLASPVLNTKDSNALRVANELSEITSGLVYNMDETQLKRTILAILSQDDSVKAVKVVDIATSRELFLYFINDGETVLGEAIPDDFSRYDVGESNIVFNGHLIGSVTVYSEAPKTLAEIDGTVSNLGLLLIVFLLLTVILFFIFKILISDYRSNKVYLAFGTKKFAYLVMGALSTFITLSLAGSWLLLTYNKQSIETRLEDSFVQYNKSLNESFVLDGHVKSSVSRHILNKKPLQDSVRYIIDNIQYADTNAVQSSRDTLTTIFEHYAGMGYAGAKSIISSNLDVIYSYGDAYPLAELDMSKTSSFIRALNGESSILPARKVADPESGIEKFVLFFAMPYRDVETKKITAVVIIEMDNSSTYFDKLAVYQFAKTGEMIAYDGNANQLSSHRFPPLNTSTSVTLSDRDSTGTIDAVRKSKRAYDTNRASSHLYKFVDYRSKNVYSMVFWNPYVNAGVLIKIDEDEVLLDYVRFRNSIMLIILSMALFTVPSMMFTLYAGSKSNQKLKDSRQEVIRRLGHAAEFKDNETALHIVRMSHYSRVLAEKYGLPEHLQMSIFNASPMHDIGKIGVPDAILHKPGKLSSEEWDIMKKHPEFGADIIGEHSFGLLKMAREISLYHHEKWDGTGYPYGTKGEDIPISARIVAVADVFDALTSERSYKKAWPIEDAIHLIISESGKHFDPKLVEVFKHSLVEFKAIKNKYHDA